MTECIPTISITVEQLKPIVPLLSLPIPQGAIWSVCVILRGV